MNQGNLKKRGYFWHVERVTIKQNVEVEENVDEALEGLIQVHIKEQHGPQVGHSLNVSYIWPVKLTFSNLFKKSKNQNKMAFFAFFRKKATWKSSIM